MSDQKKYTFSAKKLTVLVIVTAIVGGSLVNSGLQAVSWGASRIQEVKLDRSTGLMSNLNKLFVSNTPQNIQPIQVVDEQSQVIDVVKKASPAVVSIVASAEVPKYEMYYNAPSGNNPMFGFNFPQMRQNGTQMQEIGAGTGFLVSSDGYIITNKHVVNNANAEYTVYLNGDANKGEKIVAKVIARDPNDDLAVLKIDKTNLPYLTFGDSTTLQVGQTAITIGYALGEFDNTVSKGVISGLSRTTTAGGYGMRPEQLTGLIQTDAAINPGNSGGPMLDLNGNVIGVNVAMADAQSIGFAILGNKAKAVFDEVKSTGTIAKQQVAYLGVRYTPITSNLQSANNLKYDYGMLVVRGTNPGDVAVVPGSPADKAGIVENDIILEIDGVKLDTSNLLSDALATRKPGDKVTLKISSKGVEKDVEVQLGGN